MFGLWSGREMSLTTHTHTHLIFLWVSEEEPGPAAGVDLRFLGRPGPLRAGLRGVSSFL